MRAILLFMLVAAAACHGTTKIGSNDTATEGVSVEFASTTWSRPWPVIVAAAILLLGAIAAPFIVPWIISFVVEKQIEEDELDEPTSPTSYGTFSPGSVRRVDSTAEAHVVLPNSNLTPSDLPPIMEVKFDSSAWNLIHKQLDLPFGLAVSVALLSCTIAILQLPLQFDYIEVRKIANDIAQIFMIGTACFALHRLVEFMIEFLERQSWLTRTKMMALYKEIAGKIGLTVKILGALVIAVSVLGVTAEESLSRKLFFAFVTALAIGLVGWVLLELSDVAQEVISSATLILLNMFTAGDEIEIYLQKIGAIRGRVHVSNDTRTTQLICQGRMVHVPNQYFLESCVVNHTRSKKLVSVVMYIQPKTGAEIMRQFLEESRLIAADLCASDQPSEVNLKGPVCAEYITMSVSIFLEKKESAVKVRSDLMLRLLALAQKMGVTLS